MKKKRNKFNKAAFVKVADQIDSAFPQKIKKAFYVESSDALNLSSDEKYRRLFKQATGELRGDDVNLRTYRDSEEVNPRYDVDEIRAVNRDVVEQPAKSEIENHHLNDDIAADIMRRNNMTFEAVSDGKGRLKLNVRPDGTVSAFINFLDDDDLKNSPD